MCPQTLPELLAPPCAAIGSPVFLDELDRAIAAMIPHDMRWSLIYATDAAPQVLGHATGTGSTDAVDHDLIRRTYDGGYYRFDPFYRFWRVHRRGGVFRLDDIADPARKDSTYMFGFVPITGFEDDVAVLCPVSDTRALALTIERRARFTPDELAILSSCYPLVSALVASHWRLGSSPMQVAPRGTPPQAPLDFPEAVAGFLPGRLTPKEREIVMLLLAGFDNRATAQRLEVSVGTVKNHKKRLYAKLDITSERELFSLFLGFLAGADPSELHR